MTISHNCGGILNNRIQIMLQSGLFFQEACQCLFCFEYVVWEGCKDFHMQVGLLSAKQGNPAKLTVSDPVNFG